jgi:hypothetical protein
MTDFLGGGLFLAFLCALGFGAALPFDAEAVPQLEPKPGPQPESSTVSVTRPDIRPDTSGAATD